MKEEQILKNLKELRDSKDIELTTESIREIIAMYGLTMAEIAAVNYYIMQQALEVPVNAILLKKEFGMEIDQLGVEGILQVQRALISVYVEQSKEDA